MIFRNMKHFFFPTLIYLFIFINLNIFFNYKEIKFAFSIFYFFLDNVPNKFFLLNNIFKSYDNCKICMFESKSLSQNSCKQDIIIGSVLKKYRNFYPLVQTIRSVKCEAIIFLFFDDRSFKNLPTVFFDQYINCGINILNIGRLEINSVKILQFYRYFIYLLFLRSAKFSRVLSIDVYDTLFQGDPFNIFIKTSHIYFTLENTKFKYNFCNMNWIKTITNKTANIQYGNKSVINGGTIIGGYQPYYSFLKIFMNLTKFPKHLDQPIDDQGFINFIFYDSYLSNNGINAKLLDPNEGFGNIFCMKKLKINWTFPIIKMPDSDIYFFIVHQIYQKPKICSSFLKLCPPINNYYIDINKYLKCKR